MTKTCKEGSIIRKGYTRHIKNRTIRVKANCITAQSQSGEKRTDIDKAIMTKKRRMHRFIRKSFRQPRCKSGQIVKEGYVRNAYTRKNGIRIASAKVPPVCIRATGMSRKRGRKGKQLFVLQKGELTRYGYHADKPEKKRHQSLNKALTYIKPLSVYRKLNAIYVLNKNKNPIAAKTYKNDAEWVKTTDAYMKRPM